MLSTGSARWRLATCEHQCIHPGMRLSWRGSMALQFRCSRSQLLPGGCKCLQCHILSQSDNFLLGLGASLSNACSLIHLLCWQCMSGSSQLLRNCRVHIRDATIQVYLINWFQGLTYTRTKDSSCRLTHGMSWTRIWCLRSCDPLLLARNI